LTQITIQLDLGSCGLTVPHLLDRLANHAGLGDKLKLGASKVEVICPELPARADEVIE
jgi:hypothetical protein